MTVWDVLQLALIVCEVFTCYWFCNSLVTQERRIEKTNVWEVGLLFFIALVAFWNRNVVYFSYLVFAQQIFLVWLVFLIRNRKKKGMMFLLILDYHLVITLLDFIGLYFAIGLTDINYTISNIYYYTNIWRIIIFTVGRLLMLLFGIGVVNITKKFGTSVDLYKNILVVIGIIGCIWGWWFHRTILTIRDTNDLGNVIFFFSCLFVLAAVSVVGINRRYIKSQAEFIQMKNKALEENYANLHNLYKNNQYIYHDFKNHMTLLKQYMEQKQYVKAHDYINGIVGPMEQLDSVVWSGNEVVNLVMNLKGCEANEKDIRMITDIEDFNNDTIEDTDMGNILLNLLNNAIRACEQITSKEKWISVTIKKKKEMLIICIENSIEKQPNKQEGEYLSDKHDSAIHGLGIKSVRATLDKYDAEADWSNTEDIFTVVITFFMSALPK